ncbi:MAG: fused isobutyryl-CoA mutase/GTPase IcmF [Oligoflexia bacterium]|nr:fused isobutyryl-CoA mutase/GTPase IcmF [Oligoflexia bacterium]
MKNNVRIITAASLFDGHDASINIMRRILQAGGAEVIHLGHNRSVVDIVNAAIQEDAQGIAISSYQGGHIEFFKYMVDLLKENDSSHIKIFGGGGGVIVHSEKKELEQYGVTRIYHPDDGRRMGLEGMINDILNECDFDVLKVKKDFFEKKKLKLSWPQELSRVITSIENVDNKEKPDWITALTKREKKPLVVGITGTGGAGKSSLTDELIQRYLNTYPDMKIAVICVDPTKKKTGGALLGDRIRMNSLSRPGVFMRSLATRGSLSEVSKSLSDVIGVTQHSDFDLVFVETIGIGQGDVGVTEFVDLSLYVMTSEYGAPSQLEKIDMIDFADIIAINKFDRRGSPDALRDVRKQYRRSHKLFDKNPDDDLPIFGTISSQFNDGGVNKLFTKLCGLLKAKGFEAKTNNKELLTSHRQVIIPMENQSYLAEIVKSVKEYKKNSAEMAKAASLVGAISQTQEALKDQMPGNFALDKLKDLKSKIEPEVLTQLENWQNLISEYSKDELVYKVRDREIKIPLTVKSLSQTRIPKVSVPKLRDWGDRLEFLRKENVPGRFPFTAGVFPLKREGEDPRRQFAGEGTPERTNKRFHYLCRNDQAKRLSTAFDSVTLYGEDPHERLDIYGKVGESGVSICTLEDMKKLYKGFDLCDPATSVSMTINGPAPTILAFYLNTAIDQKVEEFETKLGKKATESDRQRIKKETLKQVRGTVQADILKEDQAQNTCIFSTEFSLKVMGDVQKYFVQNDIKNYYSVSISGYHIAEAGANPISQLAFTLANGFTYVEYYLSRGMKIDDFAANLSFFFSNGLDPEYAVLGRVARRIWAVSMREKYGANERSQKLKYHIQTSGRSLHAQEIDFNDIRTTLQALFAIYDNCNSLHTNAYDEAITTPTEESVRRAMAIQMIITKELGTSRNENPNQGSYFMEELTELVEEAVLSEFSRIAERGGVLGAMESQYQRGKIQEESMFYETLKHTGELPIIGVNTFVDPKTLAEGFTPEPISMIRASAAEKQLQINSLRDFQKRHITQAPSALEKLKKVALDGGNIFEELMSASRVCSLGQITHALYQVGGQYRRSL